MPLQSVYTLEESLITISGGAQLDGVTQGDGSHLQGLTITLNSNAWTLLNYNDSDTSFADNDSSQSLANAITYDGVAYDAGRRVEAEYQFTVQDPDGNTYNLIGLNIVEPGSSFGTVEGLAFVGGPGGFPPVGVPLTVTSTAEGGTRPNADLATPICFTPGTRILTPRGAIPIEDLAPGDTVLTVDNGPQTLRWVGQVRLPGAALKRHPEFRPVKVAAGAFGPGNPRCDVRLSPQHKVLVSGWRAELFFGHSEVLVPVKKLVNGTTVTEDLDATEVVYIHLLFDRHEVIYAEGMPSESFFMGGTSEDGSATRAEIAALFPELAARCRDMATARPVVEDHAALSLAL